MEGPPARFPLGSNGRLEAEPLTNAVGNHAVLVREGEQPRALVTVERGSPERQRVIIVPLDNDVEMRVDGDALAIWLSQGSIGPPPSNVPAWANAVGFTLVIAAVGFMVLGSITFFGWLFWTLGWL
ncbi:MAG: hypothetical protein H0W81_05825 [Chloroflexi bacterium]|nr:hypothetical protein [Chloroflexota bacterium]